MSRRGGFSPVVAAVLQQQHNRSLTCGCSVVCCDRSADSGRLEATGKVGGHNKPNINSILGVGRKVLLLGVGRLLYAG